MADSSTPYVPFTVNGSAPAATTSGNSFNFVANIQNPQSNASTTPLLGLSSSTALSTGITGDVTNSVSAYNANNVAASQGTQILNNAANPNWVGNILSAYQNPTYHIKFFMTQDTPLATSTYNSWSKARAAIDALPTTVVAESGVTGIVVDSLTIDTIPAPNAVTRGVSATNLTLVIKEPMGASFLDLLAQTAQDLGVNNYYKTFYFVEVSFKGYDGQGNIVNNICNAFPNGGKWLYQIGISNIEVETTAAGSTYTISAIPYEEDVYTSYNLHTSSAFTPQGSTLGEILTNLGQSMTEEDILLEGYAVNTWNFQVGKFIKDGKTYDPASWPINASNININFADLSNQGMEFDQDTTVANDPTAATNKGVRGYFPKGMKVTDIIECLFMCCPDAQMVAKDVNAPNQLDKDNASFRNCFLFRHEPSVQLSGFDATKNQYLKTITFTSLAYFTNKPILSQNDVAASQNAKNQVSQVSVYADSGYMVKRYDYMFTGLNTEVLDYNIKFNLSWTALLPNIYAYTSTTSAVVDQTMAKPPAQQATALQQDVADQQQNIINTKNAIAQSNSVISNAQSQQQALTAAAAGGPFTPDQQTQYNNLSTQIATEQAQISTLNKANASFLGKLKSDQQALGNAPSSTNKLGATPSSAKAYAEDELENVIKQRIPIATKQTIPDDEQGAMSKQYTVDRAIYGAIINQVHGAVENDLSNIALTIKGDPYWLGSGNLERLVGHAIEMSKPRNNMGQNVVNNMQPDFTYGDIMFLMSFKYSLGTNPDGTPIINQNQNFTGIYAAKRIVHTFKNGLFTQDITGIRQSLIDAFKALGLQTNSNSSTTSSVTTANSQSALSKWTLNGKPGASTTSVSKLS